DGRGSLLLAGGLADRRWRGQLQDLLVQAGRYGSWKLAQSATLAAAMERASLGETCLASEEFPGARLCAGGEWLGGQNWRATSVVERLPLALFDSLVPDSVLGDSQRLAGTVSAVLEAASRGGRLEGRLVARADSVALRDQRVRDTAPRWIALD